MKISKVYLLFCLLFCGLFACSKNSINKTPSALEKWMANNDKIKVLSTTAMIDDLVGQIGKDRIDHLTLIVGDIDPHSYELVKGDDEKLSFAQIIFYNGLGLEHGASLHYRLKKHPHGVAIGDAICQNCPQAVLKVDGQTDPHIWMDISLWQCAVDPIVQALSCKDPKGSAFYRKNGDELKDKMKAAHEQLVALMQKVPAQKRYLVTSHDAFNYFARAYLADCREREDCLWQKRFAAPEGLAPDGQISTSDIQKIVDYLCQYKIETLFPESNVSRDSLKKIANACNEKGLRINISNGPLYGDAMGPPDSNADSYLKMLLHNGEILVKEWSK